MKHQGSCHCGRIGFEVDGDIGEALECNCSICRRRGSLLWFGPRESLTLSTPEDNASTYTFNKHHIQHRFCAECGVAPYAEAVDPRSGARMVAVNVRCLPGVDLGALKINAYDGASL